MKTLLIVFLSALLFKTAWTQVNNPICYAEKVVEPSELQNSEEVKNLSDLSAAEWVRQGTQAANVPIIGMASFNGSTENRIFFGAPNGDFYFWIVEGVSQTAERRVFPDGWISSPVKKYTSFGSFFFGQTSKFLYYIRMSVANFVGTRFLSINAPNSEEILDFVPLNYTSFLVSFNNGTLAQVTKINLAQRNDEDTFIVLHQAQTGYNFNKISVVNHLGSDYWIAIGQGIIHHGRLFDGKEPSPSPLPFFMDNQNWISMAILQDEENISIYLGSESGSVCKWENFGENLPIIFSDSSLGSLKEMKIVSFSNHAEFLLVAFDYTLMKMRTKHMVWSYAAAYDSKVATLDVNWQKNPSSSFSLKGDAMFIVGLENGTMVYYNENNLQTPTFMDLPAACGKPTVTGFFSLWYLSINQFLTIQLVGGDRRTACFLHPLSNSSEFSFMVPAANPTTEVYIKKVVNYNNLTLDGWSQQKSGWCWASTISGVMYFYGSGDIPANYPNPLPSYCALATEYGSKNRQAKFPCCFDGINQTNSDLYGNLKNICKSGNEDSYNSVLGLWGYPHLQTVSGTIEWTAITREIDNNRPIILSMCASLTEGPCHSITLLGYQKSLDPARHDLNRVLIYDSSPKSDYYNEFADTYLTMYELEKYVGLVPKMKIQLTWRETYYNSIQSYQPPSIPQQTSVFSELEA